MRNVSLVPEPDAGDTRSEARVSNLYDKIDGGEYSRSSGSSRGHMVAWSRGCVVLSSRKKSVISEQARSHGGGQGGQPPPLEFCQPPPC